MMKLCRDDCSTVHSREFGLSCVFARVTSLFPFTIADENDGLHLDMQSPFDDVECGDYCYFLLDPSVRPIKCIRITIVPPEMAPIAKYQLMLAHFFDAGCM